MIFSQSVTRLRATAAVDRYGNEMLDWSDPARLVVDRLSVQPNTQNETDSQSRTLVVTGWRIYSAPGVDVDLLATDRIEYLDLTLEVVGEVARWPDPVTGRVHHVEAALVRATG